MDCIETNPLIEAHLDGELDLVRDLEVEAHLQSCPACGNVRANAAERRSALRDRLPRFAAPPHLARKIRAALPATTASFGTARPRAAWASLAWAGAGLAAGFAAVLFGGFQWGSTRARTNLVFDTAIAGHVRSLQADHLTDVPSTDQHTVKPWFAGKLDFSPPVPDLATAGFPLVGGRLDVMNGRPAAALVYHRRQHTINLFVWPAAGAEVAPRRAAHQGFQAESWSQTGLNFLAVSDVAADELSRFAETFRANAP